MDKKTGGVGGLEVLKTDLNRRAEAGLRRQLKVAQAAHGPWVSLEGRRMLNLASNNYLGLAVDPVLVEAMTVATVSGGCGATASRLIVGNHTGYREVEEYLARFKGTAAALIFPSGYHANLGTISALVGRGDVVFSDKLAHASIIDGIVLSRAEHKRFRHNDVEHLRHLLQQNRPDYRRALIVTESVFSMDGDVAPLVELVALKERYGAWLMVDEAHGAGVFGPRGQGLAHALGIGEAVEVQMGTFSKAFGCVGGYVAGERTLIDYLVNSSRSFIYSTGLPPGVVAAIGAAVRAVEQAAARRERLLEYADRFRGLLQAAGLNTGASVTQIIPA
ncbi:MAG: 8-amino-7-oxononanoate synthase, partial [Candidatus Desulforudis sp.]|nr:8-amino-7-oxononanoate synthase [Desulforudis sp.]